MGWFSADEIVAAPAAAVGGQTQPQCGNHTAQTVALCAMAVFAAGYVIFKAVAKVSRHNTERVAERAARRVGAQI